MTDLQKRMRALRSELLDAVRRFARAERAGETPPKQLLLELQRRLDHLRQSIWEVRKLCDPYLVPGPRDSNPVRAKTLAERIVHLVDARRESA